MKWNVYSTRMPHLTESTPQQRNTTKQMQAHLSGPTLPHQLNWDGVFGNASSNKYSHSTGITNSAPHSDCGTRTTTQNTNGVGKSALQPLTSTTKLRTSGNYIIHIPSTERLSSINRRKSWRCLPHQLSTQTNSL